MLTWETSQGLTDTLCAAALAACAAAVLRGRPRSPLERRLVLVFGGLALFFAVRGAAQWLGRPWLNLVAEIVACGLPLAGLWLAEGLLRRHAPRWLKIAITLAAALVAIGLIVTNGRTVVSDLSLGCYVVLSLMAITVLLITRDRASLSRQENAAVAALMLAGAGLMLLSLTDFLPSFPIGMSGAGAAGVAYIARAPSTSVRAARTAAIDLLAIALVALAAAVALAWALALRGPAEWVRLGVVLLSLAVAVATIPRALEARSADGDAQRLRRALARADMTGLTAFLGGVADQPLLAGLQMAEGPLLADYDASALADTLVTRSVWTRHGLVATDRGSQELADLMARAEASHAALISREPLRIALLTLPQLGAADEAETDFALFRKLAAIAAEARA
jgi:hypothetical protein